MKISGFLLLLSLFCLLFFCGVAQEIDVDAEKAVIRKNIEDSIGWALTKDIDRLYSVLAQDADFFIFHPDDNTIIGFDKFKAFAESVFMNDSFKATHFEVREMRINLSASGTVAWYSALLDDYGEWDGVPSGWENARWTGVLEKRDNNWVIVQMHFSFAAA